MRFTWGHAAIAMPVTIVVVFTAVLIRSMSDEFNTELVTEDYYAKELKFQDQINQTKNAQLLETKFTWEKSGDSYVLGLKGNFDPELASGNVQAFRPSDEKLDFVLPLRLDSNGNQSILRNQFMVGKYQIQVSWNVNNQDCYLEKNVFIQ